MTLLIIFSISFIFIGYKLMDKLDNLIDKGVFSFATEDSSTEDVLLYGNASLLEGLKPLLENQCLSYVYSIEPALPAGKVFKSVLALSEDDMNNLLLAASARYQKADTIIIAKCNDALFEKIFQDLNINHTILGEISEDRIINNLVRYISDKSSM